VSVCGLPRVWVVTVMPRVLGLEQRVLVVDPYNDIIGPHQVLARFIEKLAKRNWQFLVAVPSKGPVYEHLETIGVELCVLPGVEFLRRGMPLRHYIRAGWQGLVGTISLVRLIRSRKISLVHSANVNCWIGGIAARLAGVPNIYHVHDLTLNSSRLSGLSIGQAIHLTGDLVLCVSQAALRALPMLSVNQVKSTVLYNAVDPQVFYPDPSVRIQVRKELGLDPCTLLVAAFGTLDKRKGQDIFIRAAKLVADTVNRAEFLIVGPRSLGDRDGAYAGSLQDLAHQLGLAKRVHFLGARSDIPRLIQAIDVVVQPSRIEAGPIVPLEAMSSGVPVVATDVGANPEEVADGVTGILVPLGNHIAMAEAVIVLLENPLRREQLGKAGRSWVMQNFNLDAQSAKLDSIYSALIGKA